MNVDDILQLQQPVKEGGIRHVNFFNGRLLTSKDLTREQAARHEADARLGLAAGDGVAFGLEASPDGELSTPSAPVLKVKAGLAVNRLGQTLRLSGDISVALTRSFDASGSAPGACVFADCRPIPGGVYIAGAGVYVLTVAPAYQSEGRAPTNGLDPGNVRCNTDATVEGVQFRLLAVNPVRFADLDPSAPQFRNRLAYRCFGIEAREQAAADPWRDDPQRYGLLDDLRSVGLDDRDVPLALVYWTAAGLQFVDCWAVRRALLAPDALSSLAFVQRERRRLEAQAMCAQFQAQLADLLVKSTNPLAVVAGEYFRYLPPFGIVPLQALPLPGFLESTFFSGVVRRGAPGTGQETPYLDVRQLAALRAAALAAEPTDLVSKEFLWAYRPWQGVQAMRNGKTVQPFILFASGLVPDLAQARFDMARFDYSNYADCCGGS